MNWFKKKFFEATSAKDADIMSQEEEGFSLILSSYSREENILKLLEEYSTYNCFSQIIVWHNGKNLLKLGNRTDHIYLINSDDMGLSSRYAAGLLAKNEIVFLHDDDLIVPEDSFLKMAEKHIQLGRTISIHGKIPHSDGSYGKAIKPSIGSEEECEIHLNRCICTSKSIIPSFFSFLYKTKLSLDPKGGGGEDMIYSYAARVKTGLKPIALGVEFQNLDSREAISNRFGNQHKNRTKIMKVCQEVFLTIQLESP